ncbi:FAD-binding domain-containing protein [Mycena indigotica]|uniref:FAD-binding domain-containing protein n=1 Tax=Mycena indigotica TaxID=2126181 RepID=A0A8H6W8D8_9AGAR|nr:FAD-binding domain-containing protein [Mycena indigotica]KAF7306811.1 FAD-binding domain-containing protein [Mycena indigotica]
MSHSHGPTQLPFTHPDEEMPIQPMFTFFFVLVGALAKPIPSSTLVSCLANHSLAFETSQSSDWDTSTTPFNLRYHYQPAAIVYPTQTNQVSEAVKCAAQHGFRVSPLSGGHSYSASGFGQDGTLVVSLRNMTQLSYNTGDGSVNVQPGTHLGDFALELSDKYGRAAAHGICPYVGLGGHAGFGGWGLSSRNWGLVIDQVLAADLVLADGTTRHVSKTEHPDLFWAIRGASSSFGIVTQYQLQTHAAPTSVIRFALNFNVADRPVPLFAQEFARLLTAYQTWGLKTPKEMGIVTNIWQGGRDIEMAGYFMGDMTSFNAAFQPLLDATGKPNATYIQERGWVAALTEASGGTTLSTIGTPDIHDTFYAKSLTVRNDTLITTAAFEKLANFMMTAPKPGLLSETFIQFELWGGEESKISSISSDATAYPHRSHHFTVQFYGRSKSEWSTACTEYVDGLTDSITSEMPAAKFGGYANYLDPELAGWQRKYYAENYDRLEKLQKEYDPRGVFSKHQNVGSS